VRGGQGLESKIQKVTLSELQGEGAEGTNRGIGGGTSWPLRT